MSSRWSSTTSRRSRTSSRRSCRGSDGWATSPKLPGVRIPGAPFMGVSGVAPSMAQVRAWTARENDLLARGGMVFPPDAAGAVPSRGPAASEGLRTLPPREKGGNFDVKQLTKGSKLLLPVAVEGALFSTGDGHFAQGDGEDGVTEVENLTLACRNALLNLIALLQERGWTREQAYVLCSVAADLRISNVVDVPNYVVSALIPEGIFTR